MIIFVEHAFEENNIFHEVIDIIDKVLACRAQPIGFSFTDEQSYLEIKIRATILSHIINAALFGQHYSRSWS